MVTRMLAKRYFGEKPSQTVILHKYYEAVLKLWCERFSKRLDLSQLSSIIVPNNYFDDDICLSKDITIKNNATKTDNGYGFANVHPIGCLPNRDFHIIFNKDVLRFIIDDQSIKDLGLDLTDEQESMFAENRLKVLYTLHHECAHVQELSRHDKIEWYDKDDIFDAADTIYYSSSKSTWSEYYATRISIELYVSLDEDTKRLLIIAPAFEEKIWVAKGKQLRNEITMVDFMNQFQDAIQFVLFAASYLAGGLYKLSDEERNTSIENIEKDLIEKSRFGYFWSDLTNALHDLFSSYPAWESSDAFLPLMEVIRGYIKVFGVTIYDDGGKSFVRI